MSRPDAAAEPAQVQPTTTTALAQPGSSKKRRSGPRSRSSPYIGVTQYKRTGRWEAHVWIKRPAGKGYQYHLGSYHTAEDAARCYDRAAIKTRGTKEADLELNFGADAYITDAFLLAHAKTDAIKFLDALRLQYAIQSPIKPVAPQRKRAEPRRRQSDVQTSGATITATRSTDSSSASGGAASMDSDYEERPASGRVRTKRTNPAIRHPSAANAFPYSLPPAAGRRRLLAADAELSPTFHTTNGYSHQTGPFPFPSASKPHSSLDDDGLLLMSNPLMAAMLQDTALPTAWPTFRPSGDLPSPGMSSVDYGTGSVGRGGMLPGCTSGGALTRGGLHVPAMGAGEILMLGGGLMQQLAPPEGWLCQEKPCTSFGN